MYFDEDIALLNRLPLFQGLGGEALRLVAFSAEHRQVRENDILFREGQVADGAFIVTRGSIQLSRGGNEAKAVTAGAGSLIGEMALIVEGRRHATATALEASAVMRIARVNFRRILEQYPDAARAVHALMATRVAAMQGDLGRMRELFEG